MKLPTWWLDRLKTDFTPRGLFVRVAVDFSILCCIFVDKMLFYYNE